MEAACEDVLCYKPWQTGLSRISVLDSSKCSVSSYVCSPVCGQALWYRPLDAIKRLVSVPIRLINGTNIRASVATDQKTLVFFCFFYSRETFTNIHWSQIGISIHEANNKMYTKSDFQLIFVVVCTHNTFSLQNVNSAGRLLPKIGKLVPYQAFLWKISSNTPVVRWYKGFTNMVTIIISCYAKRLFLIGQMASHMMDKNHLFKNCLFS